jgi:magnesium chelatase subunit D
MLAELPTGGKTPLAAGLVAVSEVLAREMTRDPSLTPLVVILTDGRPNVPLNASDLGKSAGQKGGGWGDGWGDGGYADREVLNLAKAMGKDPRPNYVIVDTDTGNVQEINLCQPMAQYMGAKCVSLGKLTAEGVLDLVRAQF